MSAAFEPEERVLIATVRRNQREEVRIELYRMPNGAWRFSPRLWFLNADGEMAPGRGGVTMPIEALCEFANGINAAVQEARDRALIE